MARRVFGWALSVALCAVSSPAAAQQPGFPQPSFEMMEPGTVATARLPQLDGVSFKQRLNTQLPLDARFKDETGRDVTLCQYFDVPFHAASAHDAPGDVTATLQLYAAIRSACSFKAAVAA